MRSPWSQDQPINAIALATGLANQCDRPSHKISQSRRSPWSQDEPIKAIALVTRLVNQGDRPDHKN